MTEYIRPGAAAKALGVSVDTISRYVDDGQLRGIRTPGGQRRIDRSSVEAYQGIVTHPATSEGE